MTAPPQPPSNADIARMLEAIADLLDLEPGSNRWRVRAYRRAVSTIERLARPVHELVAGGEDLTRLPGIGRELARHLAEIVETGGSALLDKLAEQTPMALVPLARVRGIGLSKARRLHEALGVERLDDLERALEAGLLAGVKGFSDKSVARLADAIAAERARADWLRLPEAARVASEMCELLRGEEAVAEVCAAGAVRRQHEVVDQLVLVAASSDTARVVDRLAAHAGLEAVERASDGLSARLRRSVPVSLQVVEAARFGTALFLATGSETHVAEVTAVAPLADHASERAVYEAAGLAFIPPELREGRGEVAAARANRLPQLVIEGDIRGDLHTHTQWSDGRHRVAQMAAACRGRGYEYMAIADHSPSLAIARGLSVERLREQWLEIEAVRATEPGIVILKSCEVDILPDGTLDLPDAQLLALDCVVASVHVRQRLPRDEMTARMLRAVAHPAVDVLGHPTGRSGRRPAYDVDLEAVLRACAERSVAVELNSSPSRSDLPAEQIRLALELGCTIAIDTDAHSIRELDYMVYGVGQARRGWAEPARVLNAKRWAELRVWLQRRGGRSWLV